VPLICAYRGDSYITFDGRYYDRLKKAHRLAARLKKYGFGSVSAQGTVMTVANLAQIRRIDPKNKYKES
jgi:hypothetical protein